MFVHVFLYDNGPSVKTQSFYLYKVLWKLLNYFCNSLDVLCKIYEAHFEFGFCVINPANSDCYFFAFETSFEGGPLFALA